MWRLCGFFIACFGYSQAVTDISNICNGKTEGDLVGNPFDCQSYFICSKIPMIQFCEDDLQFNALHNICDQPAKAKCKIASIQDTAADKAALETWSTTYAESRFIAIDTGTGQSTSPLARFNASHVECVHFGAYFLPHPQNCGKYYICAYGHLHQHNCGRDTLWNFEQQECQLAGNAICYGNSMSGVAYTEKVNPTSTPIYQATVCYPIYTTTVAWQSTGNNATTIKQLTSAMPNPKLSSEPPTPGTPSWPTPPTPPKVKPTASLPATTKRAAPNCPTSRQAYLPYVEDCSKYYICIMGKPVLTSCPTGLLWDRKAEFCDLAKSVDCTDA